MTASLRSLPDRLLRQPVRRAALAAAGLALVGLPAVDAAPTTAVSDTPAAPQIHTTKTRFRIPFEFDTARLAQAGGREVLLYVSRDGATWTRAGSCPLDRTHLEYVAETDGDYRFGLKVRTESDTLIPDGPVTESLAVTVDRVVPTLAISLSDAGDQPAISWHARDDRLDPATLSLELSRDGLSWTPVAVPAAARGQVQPAVAGDGELMVRASVADRAGNVGRASATMQLGEASLAIAPSARPGSPAYPGTQPRDPSLARRQLQQARLAARSLREVNPLADTTEADDLASLTGSGGLDVRPGASSALPSSRGLPSGLSSGLASGLAQPKSAVPTQTVSLSQPADQLDLVAEAPQPEPTARPADSYQPLSDETVRVNSLRFAIAYALQQVGHSGVRQVDAYITEDAGGHWFHYGADADATSPMTIAVPREGRYGFAFRVQNGAGVSVHPPQPGERPDVSVLVDATPPRVQLTAVEPVGGADSGTIRIVWTASDRELPARPIELEWASDPAGPWTAIASAQPNADSQGGRYRWSVEPSIPPAVYVRVRATDTCGNAAESATPQPVVVDFSQPSLRVLRVTPE